MVDESSSAECLVVLAAQKRAIAKRYGMVYFQISLRFQSSFNFITFPTFP